MKLRMFLMLLACLVVFGGLFGMKFMGNKMMNEYIDAMPVPPATVSSAQVESMRWDNRLAAIGTLVPVNGADMTTEVGGIVTAIHFESGQKVAKGARLLTLDSTAEAGEVRRLKAQAELTELNRARREKLYKLEAISKSDYDAAVAEANAARAAVDSQAGLLAKKDIRAPFAGQLGVRRANVGEYLQPGSVIVTLQSLDPIDLDFDLPEQYTGSVAPGYKVEVTVEAYPGQRFAGEVLAVEPKVDSATRNFRLRARLANAENQLKPGQFGRVELLLPGERQLLVVPRTAINYNSYGDSVFVIAKKPPAQGEAAAAPPQQAAPGSPPPTDLVAQQRFVKLGEARGDFVAVVEGLAVGDQIATSGLLKLSNGLPVIINNDVQPDLKLDPKPSES